MFEIHLFMHASNQANDRHKKEEEKKTDHIELKQWKIVSQKRREPRICLCNTAIELITSIIGPDVQLNEKIYISILIIFIITSKCIISKRA